MDRPAGGLDGRADVAEAPEAHAIPLGNHPDFLLKSAELRLQLPDALFKLDELDVLYDSESAALWTFMRPAGRPSFTPALLADFEAWQRLIGSAFGPGRVPLRYLILGSRAPGVFCFGGDLRLFQNLILSRDRDGLVGYGNRCVEILERNIRALDLPMLTVGLVQGQTLGGGFEALLSFDYIIAERGSTFGLPEITFGLFPGMGAHAFLSRKLGTALADRIILSNETHTAEQMYELGIVHQLAERGEGVIAAREFVVKSQRRHAGLVNARRAMRVASPIPMAELYAIVELWADTALQLSERDLKLMQRLSNAQERLAIAS